MTELADILPDRAADDLGDKDADQLSLFAPDLSSPAALESFGSRRPEDFRPQPAAPILAMDQAALERSFQRCVVIDFATYRKPARELATAAGSNVRAAKNWLGGNNAPDLLHALKLAVTSPSWRAELRRILALDATLDPDVERALSDIVRRFPQLADEARR